MKISWVWHHTEVSWVENSNMGYNENGNLSAAMRVTYILQM